MIDLRPIIAEAGGTGLNGEAYRAATAFLADWHGAGSNEHGVYDEEHEVVQLAAVGRCKAEVRLFRTGRGHWLAGYGYDSPISGGGGPASVWNRTAYETRDEAVQMVAAAMASRFQNLVESTSSVVTDGTKRDAAKMVSLLAAIIEPPEPKMMQLDLFG